MTNYRGIWSKHYGKIPIDEEGFSYEIHHVDGNRTNNDISNLKLVSIREHLAIHLQQEDWFAAALISKRLGMGSGYFSNLQRGKKRPGIGGVKKGTVPWNKGKKGCFSKDTIDKFKTIRAGRRFGPTKVSDNKCKEIISLYKEYPTLDKVGSKMKNGKILTYERAFAKTYHVNYNVTEAQLYNIITGKRIVQD